MVRHGDEGGRGMARRHDTTTNNEGGGGVARQSREHEEQRHHKGGWGSGMCYPLPTMLAMAIAGRDCRCHGRW